MEHRWGIRKTLEVGVKLYVGAKPPRLGRLIEASSSGAYIATRTPLPVMTRIHLALGWDGLQRTDRHRIAAYVVRSDAGGMGIEWQEFAPPAVVALIDAPETLPSRDAPDCVDAILDAGDEVVYMPWSRANGTADVHRGAH